MKTPTSSDLALLAFARDVQAHAYAPYSHFRVGAAVFAGGDVFVGVNVENSAYGSTTCAEADAIAAAVASGTRDISAIAIAGDSEGPCVPCGNCRQILSEFNLDMRIIMGGSGDEVMVETMEDLLPDSFSAGLLDQDETP